MDPAMLHALGVDEGDELLVKMRVERRSDHAVTIDLPVPFGRLRKSDDIDPRAVVAVIKTARAAREFAKRPVPMKLPE